MKGRVSRVGRCIGKTARRSLIGVGVAAATVGSASAQETGNSGVEAIVTAINGLKPDLGTVVVAGIGVALIGIGAAVAISIGKRIMGK